jgi:hypothetical protein
MVTLHVCEVSQSHITPSHRLYAPYSSPAAGTEAIITTFIFWK